MLVPRRGGEADLGEGIRRGEESKYVFLATDAAEIVGEAAGDR
jgi:hypothetical protein